MYYPYLRGKQFELILLRDKAQFLSHNKIHPIIEPVKQTFASLMRAINKLKEHKTNFTLIINPQYGDFKENSGPIVDLIEKELKNYDSFSIGYIVGASSDEKIVKETIRAKLGYSFSIIHYGFPSGKELADSFNEFSNIKEHIFIDRCSGKLYQKHFKKDKISRILIRDGFVNQRNADYPGNEHFSDLHITYPDEGMNGFGDFLIVGDDYKDMGGPAHAVTIHLTYLDAEEDMFIRHFISDRKKSPADPAGKFSEALSKLVQELEGSTFIYSSEAVKEYIDLHVKGHYPGLGYIKKLSMQHHIELLANFLSKDNKR